MREEKEKITVSQCGCRIIWNTCGCSTSPHPPPSQRRTWYYKWFEGSTRQREMNVVSLLHGFHTMHTSWATYPDPTLCLDDGVWGRFSIYFQCFPSSFCLLGESPTYLKDSWKEKAILLSLSFSYFFFTCRIYTRFLLCNSTWGGWVLIPVAILFVSQVLELLDPLNITRTLNVISLLIDFLLI